MFPTRLLSLIDETNVKLSQNILSSPATLKISRTFGSRHGFCCTSSVYCFNLQECYSVRSQQQAVRSFEDVISVLEHQAVSEGPVDVQIDLPGTMRVKKTPFKHLLIPSFLFFLDSRNSHQQTPCFSSDLVRNAFEDTVVKFLERCTRISA